MRRIFWLLAVVFSFQDFRVVFAATVPDVLIVGGGLAGLNTAYRLKKAGLTYRILELSPHIGGRIRTASYGANTDPKGERITAEVGLEEFWATNPALEIFKELGVPLEKSATAFSSFVYQGKFYPFVQETNREFLRSVISPAEYVEFEKWDIKMAGLIEQLRQRPINPELMKLKDISFGEWIRKSSGLSPLTQAFIQIESEPEYASTWDEISALDGIAEWQIFSGEGVPSYHVVGGNYRGAMAMAEAVGMENISLNKQVTNIKSLEDGVEVTAIDAATFEQAVYHAKYVVTTAPLFRLLEIQFEPALSADRVTAIETQTGGSYFTAHVLLKSVDERGKRVDSYWLRDGENTLPILTGGALGVIYGGNSAEGVSAEAGDIVLNLLVTGAYAESFNFRGGDLDSVRAEILGAFEKTWPGFGSYVKKMLFYRYHPHAIASWPVGRSRFDNLSELMRQPQGRVYFAGDFTEGSHSDGAAESAVRVVQDVVVRELVGGK